jgi:hypothetical protein
MKEKMVADAKTKQQVQGAKMINKRKQLSSEKMELLLN